MGSVDTCLTSCEGCHSFKPQQCHACRLSFRLNHLVPWVGLAVSANGMMITPEPSRAVIALVSGVSKRTLVAKNIVSVSATAPLDSVQVMH